VRLLREQAAQPQSAPSAPTRPQFPRPGSDSN
jgi:hypothetical protein